MGVEPLESGERLPGHVAVDQHAASLSGDDLVHLGGRQRDQAAVCGAAVSVPALQRVPGDAGGRQRRQEKEQEKGTGGQVHFHKRMVRLGQAEDVIPSPAFPSRWPAIS